MSRFAVIFCLLALVQGVQASWYWPFGSDEVSETPRRISELMEPASKLIDEASDFAADGEIDKSVEAYRKALIELDRIERENPDRAKSPEFATLRNKRAYVNAAIDSMLLAQVKQNARAVAVSDTTELERKLAEERGGKAKPAPKAKSAPEPEAEPEPEAAPEQKAAPEPKAVQKPQTRRERVIDAIAGGDYATAENLIGAMLAEKPNGAMALNLRAALEMKQGKLDVAEETLDQAIMSNPRDHSAYYNMAMLLLQKGVGNKASARRYYETGRAMNGPVNERLEELVR